MYVVRVLNDNILIGEDFKMVVVVIFLEFVVYVIIDVVNFDIG